MAKEQICAAEIEDEAECQQKIIGLLLRRLRQIKGLSQGRLADRSDTDPSYLSGLEHGHGRVSMYKLSQVCRAMDTEEALLLHLYRQLVQSRKLQAVVNASVICQSNNRSECVSTCSDDEASSI